MVRKTSKFDSQHGLRGKSSNSQWINHGEPDEMEIFGYTFNKCKTVTTWIFYILTLGALRLIYHWFPKLELYSTHSECDLETAQKILFVDTYKGKYKLYYVKEVRNLKVSNVRQDESINNGVSQKKVAPNRKNRKSIDVNMDDGTHEMEEIRTVKCKKLLYVWNPQRKTFVKLRGLDSGTTRAMLHECEGYNVHEEALKRITYGINEINIPVAGILKLIALEALTPFYVFQLFSIAVWISEIYYYYCIAIVVMSLFGIASSVIQTRRNQKNLQGTVHSVDTASVFRKGGVVEEIPTTHLVPGDIIEIPAHGCVMQCDAVLVNGNCIVNESMLTGESVPVMKTPLPNTNDFYHIKEDSTHTLFSGTKVIQTRYYGGESVRAVVIRTGYLTTKGQLVRSILYPPPADFKFDQDSYKFIAILAAIAVAGFIYTIASKSTRGISPLDILVKALDVVTIVIPPALPAAMTVGKLYALIRLKDHKIFCMNSRVINASGSIDCVCFDKTGTLTEDGLDMWGVVPVVGNLLQKAVKDIRSLPDYCPLVKGMAVCHSLTLIDDELVGDPLDIKMFESTGWTLQEPHVADSAKYDLLVPTTVKPNRETDYSSGLHVQPEIGIIHRHQFSSALQRMSVITKTMNSHTFDVYCKGSPEMIISLSRPNTIPIGILESLKEYTEKGYRVIALGTKTLEDTKYPRITRIPREEIEQGLTFIGLVVFENRLKPQTTPVIRELREANIRIIMITGDNIQTALSVARECGIVDPTERILDIEVVKPQFKHDLYRFKINLNPSTDGIPPMGCKILGRDIVDVEYGNRCYKYAMTGTTWAVLRQQHPQVIPSIISKGVVFARMSGEQKQQLVEELQGLGYYVAMCGDGANDCGALKAAHVGISLSEAESSVASPITFKENNISCVPTVIREGRAALVTSFGVFKYMLCFSLTEFTSVMILYGIDSNLTSMQYLFIDIFLVLTFASVFGKTKAYTGALYKTPPMASLLSFVPICSIIWYMLVVVIFQVAAYYLIQGYEWFEPYIHDPAHPVIYSCYENYAVFSLSIFQYIAGAIAFSKGKPYRMPIYTNKLFSFVLIVTMIECVYLIVYPAEWIQHEFEMKIPPTFDVRIAILGLAIGNLVCCLVAEDLVVEYLMRKVLRPWLKGVRRKEGVESTGHECSWPVVDCDIKTVIVNERDLMRYRGEVDNYGFGHDEADVTVTTRM